VRQQDWEDRYSQPDRVWTGKVNHWLQELVGELPPGTALDLGCGEGGDAVWLAARGWAVTAVDFAAAALERGAAAAAAAGVGDRVQWQRADLAHWRSAQRFDLVTMHFLHTADRDVRGAALRNAWAATGGRLLVVAHDPVNATAGTAGGPPDPAVLYSAADVLEVLGLAADDPQVVLAETRERESAAGLWIDAVVLLQRRSASPRPGG